MVFDGKKFSTEISKELDLSVDKLFDDHQIRTRKEIESGWGQFFAQELWFRENLPGPIINESGRHFEIDILKSRIRNCTTDHRLIELPSGNFANYRNYLHPGPLRLFPNNNTSIPVDKIADDTTLKLLEVENRHVWFEILSLNKSLRLNEVEKLQCLSIQKNFTNQHAYCITRNQSIALERDVIYWESRYGITRVSPDAIAFTNTESTLIDLMRLLAYDFAFCKQKNNDSYFVFSKPIDSDIAWLIMFDRIGPVPQGLINFCPKLAIVKSESLTNLEAGPYIFNSTDFLFFDIFGSSEIQISDRADIERQLRFSLQRFSSTIDLYKPYLSSALTKARI